MTLSVVGLGLCSPAGALVRDHVFFPRANAPPPAPAPFVLADGRPFEVGYARFVPPDLDLPDRLIALGRIALEEARPAPGMPLVVCLPAPCEGLPAALLDDVASRLAAVAESSRVECFTGAAGVFDALARIDAHGWPGAVIVGVDSFFHADRAAALAARPPGPFAPARLWPAEGAGALVVVRGMRKDASTILMSKTAHGRGTDDDDEPVDAAALTNLLADLPEGTPIRVVFGQDRVDALRAREWEWSAARQASRFHAEALGVCLEAEIGQVGAAAGVMGLVHAFGSVRHGVCPSDSRLLAWALSQDGTRGLALGVGGDSAPGELLHPLAERVRARAVPLDSVVLDESSPSENVESAFDEATFDPDAALAPANDILPLERPLPESITTSPLVRLDPERLRPVSREAFYAEVVSHCAETLAGMGKARERSPLRGVRDIEQRLLHQIDAIVASGKRALLHLATDWAEHPEDPWRWFGGTIAAMAFEGDEARRLVSRRLDALPDEADAHARRVADALALSEHATLFSLGRALHSSARPIARAIGLSFLAARGALADEEVQRAFEDASPLVRAAALDACAARSPASQRAFLPALRSALLVEDRANAFRAARQLAILGDVEARRVFEDRAVAARLGALVGELYVLAGRTEDAAAAETFFARQTPTPALLSAAGRWGSPAILPRLLQCLADEDLSFAAAEALAVMLGPALPPEEMRDAGAWRRVMASTRLDASKRLRRGLPLSPAVVAEECASEDLARGDLMQRVDELRARLGRLEPVPVWGYAADVEASLAPLLRAAREWKGKG
ncbi:hypothetical protein [Polyangium sorediatum]|uniref:Uncharacterized protein n=1 Tax=Polyangium sorediatum TaxID=889274 RepID=A0ABT6NYJ6_9BACT|nr:hypothetical protein [Polyangium sorediatum]MDI1433421.1 hypothetical protein [Polyangium sorediatum]